MTPRLSRYFFSPILAVAMLAISSVAAADPVKTEHAEAQLVSETTALQPGKPFWVALWLRVIPDWHTYWRNPGDSGLATTLDWTLPAGFTAGPIHWPYPQRFLLEGPLVNYGYEGEVYLLTPITPAENVPADAPVTLQAFAKWLVCHDVCIPEEARLTLRLPVSRTAPALDPAWAEGFARTRQALPRPNPWPVSFSLTDSELVLHIPATGLTAEEIKTIQFFPFDYGVIDYTAAQKTDVTAQGITLTTARGALPDDQIKRVQGVLVFQEQLDGGPASRAYEIDAPAATQLATSSNINRPVSDIEQNHIPEDSIDPLLKPGRLN